MEEFLAMTFVHGPEGVTFPDDKPAKLRFFLGYVDNLAPGGEDGRNQVIVFFCVFEDVLLSSVAGFYVKPSNSSRQ